MPWSCELNMVKLFLEHVVQNSNYFKNISPRRKTKANLSVPCGYVHQIIINIIAYDMAHLQIIYLNKSQPSYFSSHAYVQNPGSMLKSDVKTHSIISGSQSHVQCFHWSLQPLSAPGAWGHFSSCSPPFGGGWPRADSGNRGRWIKVTNLIRNLNYNIRCNLKTS